ncbi:hypothetical protein [Candidatus Poriferisodalis sp.]
MAIPTSDLHERAPTTQGEHMSYEHLLTEGASAFLERRTPDWQAR